MRKFRLIALFLLVSLLLAACSSGSPAVLSDGHELPETLSKGFCPSVGKVRIPVIPIGFPGEAFTPDMLVALKVALNSEAPGSKTSGGAAGSVASFYRQSSYGKLELSFDVLPTVSLLSPSFLEALRFRLSGAASVDSILSRAMKKLDKTVDFSEYDSNGDGLLDGAILIYAHPETEDYETMKSLWWSWFDYSVREETFDGVKPMGYLWSSAYSLMSLSAFSMTDEIDPYILIHEAGHLFGLEDYYDTDPTAGTAGGLGYFDIMDSNFGDHAPFSKYQLGWIEPTVITGEGIYEIRDFSTAGETLLFPFGEQFEGFGSEYVMLDLFTPAGLGVLAPYWFGIETPVVRAFQVDARLETGLRLDQYENLNGFYYVNNSTTPYKLLSYIEADGNDSLTKEDAAAAPDDFFTKGSVLAGVKSHTGVALPYVIRVLSIENGVARIKVSRAAG